MNIFQVIHINTAHAAVNVPGTVPVNQPLQPAPIGVKPDVSHNTNSVANPEALPEGSVVQQSTTGQTEVITPQDQSGVFPGPAAPAAATQWLIVLGVVIVIAIGLLLLRRYFPGQTANSDRSEDQE